MNEGPPDRCEPAPGGRQFTGDRRVRLGDVTGTGRLRLDALTRYTQDVSDDDTTEAGLDAEPAWVVRRTRVEVLVPAQLGEDITITTFCSGLGRRWAQRHLRVIGAHGTPRYEVSTLWICLDPDTGRPRELSPQFLALYGPAAGGRTVSARLTLPKAPATAARWPWPLRAVDYDVYGHVNNAAYWAVVEEILDRHPRPGPFVATVEYSAGLDRGAEVEVAQEDVVEHDDTVSTTLWWLTGAVVAAAARICRPDHTGTPDPGPGPS